MTQRVQHRSAASGAGVPVGEGTVVLPTSLRLGVRCGPGGGHSADEKPAVYAGRLAERPDLVDRIRTELAGADLACTCPPGQACIGDVVVAVAAGADPVEAGRPAPLTVLSG